MFTLRVWFVMIAMSMVLAGASLYSAVRPASAFALPDAGTGFMDALYPPEIVPDTRIDLYGNEIQDAVGEYRIDPRGDIYERHSPDTEVTRLGPPTI